MKFSETHEWIELNDQIGTVGVSNFAQKELGDIVYVELPQVGKTVKAGEAAAVLESTKAAADVYSPVSGLIVEVNTALSAASEKVNESPEKEGWLFKIKVSSPEELNTLLDAKDYQAKFSSN